MDNQKTHIHTLEALKLLCVLVYVANEKLQFLSSSDPSLLFLIIENILT